MTTRGIFILENVRSRQREGDWVPVDNIWVSPSYGVPFAYLAGKYADIPSNLMNRLYKFFTEISGFRCNAFIKKL